MQDISDFTANVGALVNPTYVVTTTAGAPSATSYLASSLVSP